MFNKLINIAFIFIFFNSVTLAYADIDQWQDSDKTYKDLIDEGFDPTETIPCTTPRRERTVSPDSATT